MNYLLLDGLKMLTKQDAHNHLKDGFQFPEYYGGNLDALYDLLSTWSEPVEVRVENYTAMMDGLGKYGVDLIKTIKEASHENWKVHLVIEEEKNEADHT
jgi:ribonuclease inhibitor